LLHAIQSPPPADFTPPYGFLGLEISTATAESGCGLGFVYIIFLFTYERSIGFLLLHFIYIKIHLFPIKTTTRNASKGGKPDRKPYSPYGFRILYKTINQ
jgi:hypothetical protein